MNIPGMSQVSGMLGGGIGSILKYWWVLLIIVFSVIIISVIGLIAYYVKTKKSWNIRFRIRQEDTQRGVIYLDPVIIKGKRVTLSNGLRLIYLEKPILGKQLFPNLNHYTTPGIYDLIITRDNRIFLIDGIKGIDEDRKLLKVGVRYPGIDYSLEEVNRDHAKLNKSDRKSDLLGIVKAASMIVIAIVLLIGLIVAGKYYVEAKQAEAQISQSQLDLFNNLKEGEVIQLELNSAMKELLQEIRNRGS